MRGTATARGQRHRLVDRAEDIAEALLGHEFADVAEPERSWLREQYAHAVPLVLVDALAAVDEGTDLSPDCLGRLRALAARTDATAVPLSVALRGSLPALRVFGRFLRGSSSPSAAGQARSLLLMARASTVAQELGSAWIEGWLGSAAASHGAWGVEVDADALTDELDPDDRVMVEMVAGGRSNQEIARATHFSRQAVGWRLSRLMRRWRVGNRAALVSAAFTHGVLSARRRRVIPPEGGSVEDRRRPDGGGGAGS